MKKISLLVLLSIILLTVSALYAQSTEILWKDSFGGKGNDRYVGITPASDGGYVVIGNIDKDSYGTGSLLGVKATTLNGSIMKKYNANNTLAWSVNIAHEKNDVALNGITTLLDGSFIAVGDFDINTATINGAFGLISRFDSAGKQIYQATCGDKGENHIYQVVGTADGGFAVVGSSSKESFGTLYFGNINAKGEKDAVIIKYDMTGNILWKKNFNGKGVSEFKDVIETKNGDIVAIGYSDNAAFSSGDWIGVRGRGKKDGIIVKYDKDGKLLWKKNFGGAGDDYFNSLAATTNDNYIIVGTIEEESFDTGNLEGSGSNGESDGIFVKYDSKGTIIGANNFGGASEDSFVKIKSIFDDNFIVLGYSFDSSFLTGDFRELNGKGGINSTILKITPSCEVIWMSNFGGGYEDYLSDVTVFGSGEFVCVGSSTDDSFNSGDLDAMTGYGEHDGTIIRFKDNIVSSTGDSPIWKHNFGGSADETFYRVVTTTEGDFIAVGFASEYSFGEGDFVGLTGKGYQDGIIVKYSSSGQIIWKKNFGGANNDFFYDVTITPDGGCIAVGGSTEDSFNTGDWLGIKGKGNADAIFVKYDKNGNVVWKKNFGGADDDIFNSVATLRDGTYIAVGKFSYNSYNNGDLTGMSPAPSLIELNYNINVRFNDKGEIKSKKRDVFPMPYGGRPISSSKVFAAKDGGYIVLSSLDDNLSTYYSAHFLFKYNSQDTLQWNNFIQFKYDKNLVNAITQTVDSGFIVTLNQSIIKLNSKGEKIWEKSFDRFLSVIATADGGSVAVGRAAAKSFNTGSWANIEGAGDDEAFMVKFDSKGNVVWQRRFGSFGEDSFNGVIATLDGGFVAVGYGTSFDEGDWDGVKPKGSYDATIVKFSDLQ